MSNLKVISLPTGNCADVPQQLRDLADGVEQGNFGPAHNIVWVCDCGDEGIEVGLCGQTASPGSVAYYLLGLGQRRLERVGDV